MFSQYIVEGRLSENVEIVTY